MAKKIYVGNVPFSLDDSKLKETFEAFGEVTSAQIVTDRDTGRSKGFGFVEMTDGAAAQAAIDELNGSEVDGRTLTVNEARPREDRGARSGGGRRH